MAHALSRPEPAIEHIGNARQIVQSWLDQLDALAQPVFLMPTQAVIDVAELRESLHAIDDRLQKAIANIQQGNLT